MSGVIIETTFYKYSKPLSGAGNCGPYESVFHAITVRVTTHVHYCPGADGMQNNPDQSFGYAMEQRWDLRECSQSYVR